MKKKNIVEIIKDGAIKAITVASMTAFAMGCGDGGNPSGTNGNNGREHPGCAMLRENYSNGVKTVYDENGNKSVETFCNNGHFCTTSYSSGIPIGTGCVTPDGEVYYK
jgi:hypothetical protein